MKMKKFLALLTAGTMAFALAACGSSSDSSSDDSSKDSSSSKSSGDGIELLNGKPEIDEQLQNLAKAYKEETGVEVTVTTVGCSKQATASDTLKKRYQADSMPDIFVAEANQFANWDGMLADLTDEKWVSNTDVAYKDGDKVYGFPCYVEAWGLAYNADILEQASIPRLLQAPLLTRPLSRPSNPRRTSWESQQSLTTAQTTRTWAGPQVPTCSASTLMPASRAVRIPSTSTSSATAERSTMTA